MSGLPTKFRFFRVEWSDQVTISDDGKIEKEAKIIYYWWAWPIVIPQVLFYRLVRLFKK